MSGQIKKKRTFDSRFKVEAVNLILKDGHGLSETARRLGIGVSTLSKWVRAVESNPRTRDAFPGKGQLRPAESELKTLEKELERVKRERDILKKALGYFANPQM